MDFIHIENLKKKIYTIQYNNYLEWFLSDKNLLVSVSSDKITFQIDSLLSLHDYIKTNFLNEKFLNKFIYDLGSQILFLKNDNIGISYFSLNDIIIINNTHFLFINPNKLFIKGDISNDHTPFVSEGNFISPELKKDIKLSSLHFSTAYYSLAKIVLHVFDFVLDQLYYTHVYFFLQRCLVSDPLKRDLLFV